MSSIRSGKFSYKPPGSSSGHSDFEYGPDIGAHTRFEKSDQKTIELKRKMRPLRIRMLDGSVKTVLVDESQTVANLMVIICTKIGLTNHDEYSLVREVADELKKSDHSSRTLTLRREKRDKDKTVDQTMETLKKKLKTDDDLDWVDQSKTLPDQGIGENETLLLRRKFFFSDSNIDSGDPVQLNLLYVQTRDAIIKGTHPVTQEQAITFAGIQCQIQYGDHSESKHRTGFLDLKDYLPKELVKVKRIEKFIFTAHRKQFGLSELDAKVKYVQLARSLKTYGVTFFLVKEKIKGKNKLSPRLLGVTKDSVLRLDERTKEILETWPLTTVKRWAASPNSFTLDFGDYSDSYYSVQTNEGEQIAQLIAGYIDIILKRKKAKDHFGIEGDEGSTMVEDSVAPYKATILQYQPAPSPKLAQPEVNSIAMPAVLRAATKEPEITIERSMPPVQMTTVKGHAHVGHVPSNEIKKPAIHSTGLSGPQRALLSTIEAGKEVIKKAEKELSSKARLPDIGNDPSAKKWKQSQMDVKKQNVASQLSAMNAATAQLVTLTGVPPKELETMAPAIGAAVSTITSNLPEMSKDVRVIATLMEDEAKGDELLDAARRLCKAFSDLLKAAEPTSKPSRPQLLNSAGRVGEASHAVLATIGEEDECDRETTDILLSIAKHVANAAATLVLKAKDVTAKCDPSDQAKVIESANECALATSQLVTTAKVVSPTIQNPSCQKELTEACKKVARAVENVLKACQLSCKDPKLIADLREAAAAVTRALNQLLDQVNMYGSHRAKKVTENDGPVDTIIDATDKLFSSTGDAGEMVKQAKVLAQATSQLITDIKGKAGTQSDSDIQKRLLAAARVLADATSRLVDAAKGCATNPHDSKSQAALKKAAEDVVNATNTAVSNALRKKVINRLEVCARQTASAATQNIAAIHGAGQHNTNRILHDELELICSEVSDSMPSVVSGIKDVHTNPDDPVAQIQLINACEAFIDPTSRMANTSKAAIPNISDPSSSLSLRNSAQQLDEAISELKISLIKAQEACYTSFEIENAIEAVKELIVEVNGNKKAAVRGTLKPLPGETIERCITQLSVDCKTVGSGMAELLTAASQGNEVHVGAAARDTTIALRDMTRSVRGVAATSSDPEFQVRTLQNSIDVLQKSIELFEETKWALENINDKERQPRLTYVAKNVSNALSNCINSMPGHRDIDDAIRTINESNTLFTSVSSSSMSSKKSYVDLSNNLIAAANRLNESASDVVANSRSPVNLSSSSKRFTTVFGSFATTGMEMVGGIKDESIRKTMVSSLQSISSSSSKLLLSARSVSSDPHSLSAKNTLGASQRSLSDAISNLINLCSTGAPGQTEVDAAIRRIQMAKPMLDNTIEPINLLSYFNCLDGIVTISQKLRDIMTNIGNSAERCESETFCNSVREGADSVCDLIETSAQSAYLIAAADSTSVAGRPGLVDISTFHKSNDAITEACEKLTDRSSSQQQILAAATAIARHTSSLCNSCRLASSRTNNPIAKRHFVQSAKDVANATAALVKEIKTLDSQPNSEVVRKHCSQATKPLIEAVQNLTAFASSDEFAGIPARISDKARLSQLPITSAAKQTCDSFCNLLTTAKSLILKPQDGPGWSMLSTHGESVDTSVQTLISALKEAAPGQRECDLAIEKLRRNIRDLDSASMSLHQQTLSPRADHSFKTYREILHSTLLEIADKIDPLRVTGKCEAESLGHRVTGFSAYFDPLVDNVIGAISKISNGRIQSTLFSQTKTVCECGLQMVFSVKESGGNAKNTDTHADVDEAGECLKEAINDLSHTLQTTSPGAAHVPVVVDSISKSIGRMDGRYSFSGDLIDPNLSFVDYQTRMINLLREITRIAQEINTKSVNKEVDQLGELTNQLASNFSSLTLNTIGAVGTTANYEVGNRIKSSVQELGSACIQLTKVTGGVQDDPDDLRAQHDVTQQSHHVCEKASYVLAALQAGSRGTQACINAASVVSGIIGDLDTTIMFATAGTLNPEDPDDSFAAHRESILKCAKALVEDTKALFVGAASDQEKLADAAGSAVEAIVKLADEVKQGATSLGSRNSEAQVLLLNSAKDVATALGDLVIATKSASGKSNDDPTMISMKESAKHMISNVTSLLKTVKTVEDEHQRGTRALEQTIAAIDQELRLFDSSEPPRKQSTPEDLIRITKPVTIATAKSVAAGNSGRQDDIITAANLGRKAIFDLLVTTRQAAYASDSSELRSRTLDVGRGCALKYRQLLQMVRQCVQRSSGATNEERQILIEMSRDIASSVTEIVSCAEMLKGSDWVDPDDPTVIAETELLGAAASIDAAAQKLASLQPRRVSIKLPHDDMSFDEMILEAAKSITAATAALLRAACAAQRELVAAGRLSNHPVSRSDDGEWSEGLISAARLVAAATHSLVEAANALVQGHASEEKLISAAKQVATSTAHLLVACQVKADPDSKTMLRLQAAGNAVKRATDALVLAAQRAIEVNEETSLVISKRKVPSIAIEISAREEILRKERELHEARDKLAAIHKAKYNQKGREYYDLSYSGSS